MGVLEKQEWYTSLILQLRKNCDARRTAAVKLALARSPSRTPALPHAEAATRKRVGQGAHLPKTPSHRPQSLSPTQLGASLSGRGQRPERRRPRPYGCSPAKIRKVPFGPSLRRVTGKPLGKDRNGPRRGRRHRVARSVLTSGSSAAASPGGRAPRGCRPRARRQPAPWRAREKACSPSGPSAAYAASPRRAGGQALLGSHPALAPPDPAVARSPRAAGTPGAARRKRAR